MADSWHWYSTETGDAVTDPIEVDGRMMDPGMRAARKGAPIVPSVTSILGELGVPRFLMTWASKLSLEQAVDTPPRPGETVEEYVYRVWPLAEARQKRGADIGTRVHAAIETHIQQGGISRMDTDIAPIVAPMFAWLGQHVSRVLASERSFATHVYGGRYDLLAVIDGVLSLVDFKTQGAKKLRAYDSWGEQLVAYLDGDSWRILADGAQCYPPVTKRAGVQLVNVIIPTREPGPPVIHVWKRVDVLRRLWQAKLRYFQLSQNWWPTPPDRAAEQEKALTETTGMTADERALLG